MKATFVAIFVSCAAIARAAAQDVPSPNEPKIVTVTANFQLSVPVDASASTAEIGKALAQANDALSGLAERECDVMAAAFKRECRIAQINVKANLNTRRLVQQSSLAQPLGADANAARRVANANMNLTMELTVAPDAANPAAAPAAK